MKAWSVRGLRYPPCADRVCLRGAERAVFRAYAGFARAAVRLPLPWYSAQVAQKEAAAGRVPALRPFVRRDLRLRRAFLRAPCRWTFPQDRAPWIRRRGRRSRLRCTPTLPL